MAISGIAIDAWKLPIFDRLLTEAGYSYKKAQFTEESLFLTVEFDDMKRLSAVVKAAQSEAQLSRN